MKRYKVLLLVVIVLAIFSLFIFTSWTNAMVVQGEEIPAGLNLFSKISPLIVGIFIMGALALLILISAENK